LLIETLPALETREYPDDVELVGKGSVRRCKLLFLGNGSAGKSWLRNSIYNLVAAQGTVVPTYWEIAQNMLEKWLPKSYARDLNADASQAQQAVHPRLTVPEFTEHLKAETTRELNTQDLSTNFDLLRQNYNDGEFLNFRRIERTLRFLTHSGWQYWKADLHDSRVIIDQRWALETAYATLQRRKGSVRDNLIAGKGIFTFQNLKDWCWKNQTLDGDDQKLILSFMTSVGVCFELSQQCSSREMLYISPTQLPDSTGLTREFGINHPDQKPDTVASKQLHRGHWFAILRELCKRYGSSGTWTKDACLIRGSTYRWNHTDREW